MVEPKKIRVPHWDHKYDIKLGDSELHKSSFYKNSEGIGLATEKVGEEGNQESLIDINTNNCQNNLDESYLESLAQEKDKQYKAVITKFKNSVKRKTGIKTIERLTPFIRSFIEEEGFLEGKLNCEFIQDRGNGYWVQRIFNFGGREVLGKRGHIDRGETQDSELQYNEMVITFGEFLNPNNNLARYSVMRDGDKIYAFKE